MASLEISLFGGLCVRHGADRRIELAGRKDGALLGYLAVSPGVLCPRETLASLLWSGSGDRQARDNLKHALVRLRRSLSPASPMPLVANRQSVTLERDLVTVDVGVFEQLLADGAPEALERAVALYGGDLLDGIQVREAAFEDWLLVERQRLSALAVEASTRLMTQSLAAGRRDRAAAAARRVLSVDPLHEAACRTLMRVHAERAERAQALKLFESLRDRLRRELAVAPEDETVQLFRSIRGGRNGEAAPIVGPAGSGSGGAQAAQAELERAPRAAPSIAVLPFASIGGDPEQECFADGLTEDIITDLSRVSALFVAARNSVRGYKGTRVPLQQAARELGVGYVLQGCVRRAAGRVRVTAQLVDGATGGLSWANRYDRSLDDVFALQDEITESIVDALKVKLRPEELADIDSRATGNVDAYQYFLMGRALYLRGIDKRSLSLARRMFAKAIDIDPGYARGYAAAAICESCLSMDDPYANCETSLANGLRALELGPQLAEAHVVKGLAHYDDGRYAEAAPEFERALELAPDLFEAAFFYARNCRLQGLHEQAAALFERAAALRASDFLSPGLLARSYKALGRRQDMLAAARQCLERVEAAVAAEPDNARALAIGSAVLAELGQRARADDWAARALAIGRGDYLAHYNVARTYAILGEPDAAMERLEQAFDSSSVWRRRLAAWMASDGDIDPLRRRPRFHALVQRLEADPAPQP